MSFFKKVRRKWGYSLFGLAIALREEKSLWAYLALLLSAIGLGIYAELSIVQWCIMLLAFFITITTELINTAVEAAVDAISFQYNVKVKKIKDIASAATLVATVGTVIIVVLIFVAAFTGKI